MNWAFFLFVLYSPLVTVIITRYLHSDTKKIAESVAAKKINDDDVYHSAEVFRINYAEMHRKFKIYMYPDEDEITMLHVEWYETQFHFYDNIRGASFFFTEDPERAHLFFIPIAFHKLHTKVRFKKSYEEVGSMLGKYVEGLIHKYPYWNRTLGSDHFFLSCRGFDVEAAKIVPMLLKNSIRVVSSSTYNDKFFIPHKDVSGPPLIHQYPKPRGENDTENRITLGYWAGFTHSNTTTKLLNLWGADNDLDIQNTTRYGVDRIAKLRSAKFCICPIGVDDTNTCVTMAIISRCVPVILENYFDLPFNDVLNWHKFSVILNEHDVYRLKDILKTKEGADYRMLYNNLVKVRRHFEWHAWATSPVEYDAFHMTLYELWLRRHTIRY